jgi:putative intracellular protease/amidase
MTDLPDPPDTAPDSPPDSAGPAILLIVTSVGPEEDAPGSGGFDWHQLAQIYWRLREAGAKVAFASPRGGKPAADPATAGEDDRPGTVDMFLGDPDAVEGLARTLPLAEIAAEDWDAVVLLGGAGARQDFAGPDGPGDAVGAIWARGGVVAALAEGIAGLLRAEEDGRPLVDDRNVAVPADPEDATWHMTAALASRGARTVEPRDDDDPLVVEEGRLITGATRTGAADLAIQVLEALAIFTPE